MSGFVIHENAKVLCGHSLVPAQATSPDTRVSVSGMAVMTVQRYYAIACTASSSACTAGEWKTGAQRVTAGGLALAIHNGVSACAPNQLPLHPLVFQTRVTAG
jgi:hypothetical protein